MEFSWIHIRCAHLLCLPSSLLPSLTLCLAEEKGGLFRHNYLLSIQIIGLCDGSRGLVHAGLWSSAVCIAELCRSQCHC